MSLCGCIRRVNGVPVTGGGAVVAAGYECVYEVDFRDAHSALGNVDLNSPGASFTFEGIAWTTPSIANSGVNQAASATSWGLTSNGLEVVGGVAASVSSAGPNFPHVFANLADIAANTATPFDGDPTRKYILQCFVSATNAATLNEESGIGLYSLAGFPTGTGDGFLFSSIGFFAATANVPSALGDINPGAPTRFNRADLGGAPPATLFDCPTMVYASSGNVMDGYAGSFDAGGDWPANEDLRAIGGLSPSSDFNAAMPLDPLVAWRVAMGHNGTFDGVIERFRMCRI